MDLTTLDASLFTLGNEGQQKQFSQGLVNSISRCGFVKIVNHGLRDEEIDELFAWNRRFFQLPAAQKVAIAHQAGPEPQRGWSCVGAEKTSKLFSRGLGVEDLTDAREHFDQGSPLDPEWPSRWPDEDQLPGFRSFMESFYEKSHECALVLLRALEDGLNLPRESIASRCSGTASEMRLNHYPTITIDELRQGKTSRIHPHADLGVITCLFQDGQGGLEMEDRDSSSSFIPIGSRTRSEMIVNASETLQLWTNDVIRSGVHQVTIPAGMKHLTTGQMPERYSCAFFLKANRNASVAPINKFVNEEQPAKYPEMSAIEYHQRRLATAY